MQSTLNKKLSSYYSLYDSELLENVVPFWERHCPDTEYGGYFTCLDRDGSVYDSEKFVWMQWRIVWMFSELYAKVEPREEWLRLAESGYKFLTKHGRDASGRYYFSLARNGDPAVAPYSIYSDCFAVMGAAAYYRITSDPSAKQEATRAFESYLMREGSPKGEWTKELGGRPKMRSLGFYMMKANLFSVLEECLGTGNEVASGHDYLGTPSLDDEMKSTFDTVLTDFWNPEYAALFENVPVTNGHKGANARLTNGHKGANARLTNGHKGANARLTNGHRGANARLTNGHRGANAGLSSGFDLESMTGRQLNPGHALEAMWFILHGAARMNDQATVDRAVEVILAELELGWDKEFGGIYYFMDVLGRPHVELQWNMKLWWVHCEALIAAAMAYKLTGRQEFADWFRKIHDWTWSHFTDPGHGEWYGYLDRFGNVTHSLKGGKWKGFFHLPRMLLTCRNLFATGS